jgi:16S rRNA (cytosine1402-N4)-methyltransferase
VDKHQPVLLAESIQQLHLQPNGIYVDATFGRGGHSRAILAQLNPSGRLISIDRDPQAIAVAQALAAQDSRCSVFHADFAQLANLIQDLNLTGKINGLLFDLGVSSPQLEQCERGFSFMRDGPLDMRMDNSQGQTASAWLNNVSLTELTKVLKDYGEERYAKRIAQAIIKYRLSNSLNSSLQLANIIAQAHPAWEVGQHPATRSFQAIRIFINQELEQLQIALNDSPNLLAVHGRLVVISFHSLEDRLVKRFIRQTSTAAANIPNYIPITAQEFKPQLKSLGKPIRPTTSEIKHNPRARSAILRAAEKLYC